MATSLKHVIRAALVWAVCCVAPVMADQTRLSLNEARLVSVRLLQAGRPQQALEIAQGILKGAPEDFRAFVVMSRAYRDMGRSEDAVRAAKDAWRVADTETNRYYAAMLAAQSHAAHEQNAIAQYWLRRAVQLAPDDRLKGTAVRDFRALRSRTPWRLSLNASVSPSDNLNDAPKTNSYVFNDYFTLTNATAVPLSGVRYGGNGQLRYTIPVAERSRLHLELMGGFTKVAFSASAKQKPWAEEADYATSYTGGAVEYERIAPDRAWLAKARLRVARHWRGGEALADIADINLRFDRSIAPGWEMSLQTGMESIRRLDSDDGDSVRSRVNATVIRRLKQGALSFDLGLSDTDADSAALARSDWHVGMGFRLAKPVRGMLPRMSLQYTETQYDKPLTPLYTTRRRDEEWSLNVDVLLPKLDYYGFAPEVGLTFRDKQSSYTLEESQSTDLRIGIRSVF